MSTGTMDPQDPTPVLGADRTGLERGLDVERDSDVPISTQIYWQLAYQIESGRLQSGRAPLRPSASSARRCA